MLTAFFTVHGLALAPDRPRQRAAARRERYRRGHAAPLRDAVAEFDHTQISEQDRAAAPGSASSATSPSQTRLRILRDLAQHLNARRTITGWAEVATADLEDFLARAPAARHQRTYVLRRFFAWAKGRKLILTDPTRGLSLGAQPAFTGTVLDITPSGPCSSAGPGTHAPTTNGSSACSRCCTPRPTPRSGACASSTSTPPDERWPWPDGRSRHRSTRPPGRRCSDA